MPAPLLLKRDAFAPPPERGLGPAATLAILVHMALLLCLSWVVKWHDQPVILTAQAELWAKLPPQNEAERPEPLTPPTPPTPPTPVPPVRQPDPPAPPPPPAPAKATAEPVKPAPKVEPAPPPKVVNPKVAEADIATQKKNAKKLADEQAQKLALEAEAARKQKEKEEADAAARKQKEKEEADAAARKQKEKEEADAAARKQREKEEADAAARKQREKEEADAAVRKQREDAEAARKQKEKDDAEAARKQKEREDAEAARKAKEKEEAARKERERQRKEQEDRIKKMAKELEIKEQTEDLKKRILKSADLEITAVDSGNKLVAKISDKYAASIQAAIRPNITFDADTVSGNPAVEIQVGLDSNGTIISISTVKPSGVKSWDTAATRALDKTERLPKDENGRVPPTLSIILRPHER